MSGIVLDASSFFEVPGESVVFPFLFPALMVTIQALAAVVEVLCVPLNLVLDPVISQCEWGRRLLARPSEPEEIVEDVVIPPAFLVNLVQVCVKLNSAGLVACLRREPKNFQL